MKDEEFAARRGFFIHIANAVKHSQTVLVRRWSLETQDFEKLEEQQEELAYQEGVRNMDFDKGLGAYPMENHGQWQGLSNYISTQVIQKIESLNSIIMSEEEER